MTNRSVLLAYGEKEFTKKLKAALERRGYTAAALWEGDPPRAQYDFIVQLARDPADLAEGTRLLLEKTEKDHSRLIFLNQRSDEKLQEEAARFAQTLLEDARRRNEAEVIILNLGRIYGPGVPSKDSGALGHLITEFAEGNVLTLYGEGQDRDYYIFVTDALEGIALAVDRAEPGGTYALAPSIPTTSEAAAKLLYELGGERHEIVFHRGLTALAEKGEVPGKPLPEFKIKTPFHEGILNVLKTTPPPARAETGRRLPWLKLPLIRLPRLPLPHLRLKPPHLSPRRLKIAGIILLLLSPFLYLGGETGLAAYQLYRTKGALEALDFSTARSAASAAAAGWGRLGRFFSAATPLEEISRAVADVADQGTVLTTALENLAKSRRGETTVPQTAEDFRNLAAAFSSAEEQLSVAWLEAKQIDSGVLAGPAKELQALLDEGLKVVRLGSAFAKDAEDLLGYRGERNYLILFQNSTEIRSDGGFLGSLAQLTLQNGGIKKLEFFDSYQFDSAQRIPSHPAFQAVLGWEALPLREVNIFPSFPTAAQKIATIFESAQGVPIHGVVGTTLSFAKDLLSVTGGLALTEEQRSVTAENLFAVTTEEVEKEFFPGSTKKKRFMQALGEGLLEKVFSLSQGEYAPLARQSWQALEEKDLLFYFGGGELYQALLEAEFDGRIATPSGDYLAVFDNSFGAKVNGVWVQRSLAYRVFSPDRNGQARAELTITWNHTGTNNWPSGTYTNLLLTLVPKGSQFLGAWLNEASYADVQAFEEEGKTEFAAYLTIPYQTSTSLKIAYALPKEFDFATLESYRLTVQKQPGTAGDPFTFSFEPSIGKEAGGANLQKKDNGLIFEGNLEKDLSFTIEIKER